LHVWLLEVNPGPDLKQTGRGLQGVVNRMLEDTVTVALEKNRFFADAPSPSTKEEPSPSTGRVATPLEAAQAAAKHTGFEAIYADDWGTGGASGGSKMTLY